MKIAVKAVMTSRVVWVTQDVPYKEMAAALRENRVSAFPVLDDEGKVIGVVSEADLLTHPAVTVGPGDSIEKATKLMHTPKVKRLPVIDGDGRLTGIVSLADVLSVSDRPDDEIRSEITGNVLLAYLLVDPAAFTVTVNDGVVTLTGVPETNYLGYEIVQRVRHVPGVVAIRDRLSYFVPTGRQ
jgi:CBS-domain-containing membrane protein